MFPYIMDGLAARGKPCQKNTLIVLLSRLMNKGSLSAKKIGRRNEYTIAAERSGIKKPVELCANPLVHLMSREITKACEFSCAEAVLAKMVSPWYITGYHRQALAVAGCQQRRTSNFPDDWKDLWQDEWQGKPWEDDWWQNAWQEDND